MVNRALVVDNHPVILKFMKVLLEKRGYEVGTASDGLSALETLKTFTPDVVFLDLVMPNIDGEKLCRMMRRLPSAAEAYIVILSAVAAEAQLDHVALGADACIAKGPFESMAVHIQALLERYEKAGRPQTQKDIIGLEDLKQRAIIKELLSVKRHFEKVLDRLSEGILELTADEKIVYANPAAVNMIGAQEEELLGTSLSEHLKEPHLTRLRAYIQSGKPEGLEVWARTPMALNGKHLFPEAMPLQDEDRQSYIVILKDVTRERMIENRLLESQKTEAIGTLAGGIAHQFNNTLAVIVGNMEFMKMAWPESADMARYLEPMGEAVRRMAQLNDHLLAYARGGKYNPKGILVSDFFKQALPVVQHALDQGIHVESDIQGADTYVDIDTSQMQMVLSALLSNAAEAMDGEGTIRIESRKAALSGDDLPGLALAGPGPYVRITVQDSGHGMDEETQNRIFEPFFTTKFKGRGMGMSAVYGIVKNHGGWIYVESAPGRGTSVNLLLPEVYPENGKCKIETSEMGQSKGTILLIEDEPMVLDVNRELLEGLGYRVLPSRTGKEALSVASSNKGSIDVAILDIALPDMDALALHGLLRETLPDLKVIVCSGYSVHGRAREILDKGAQGFLQKPFTLEKLSAMLKEVLKNGT